MKKEKIKSNKSVDLRRKAEEKLSSTTARSGGAPDKQKPDVNQLLHELEVHQIELEMQNDELRKAQIIIEEARHKYFELYDLAPVGYLILDEKGKILDVNLTAAELFGTDKISFINKNINSYITRPDRDILYLHLEKLIETKSKQSCELKLMKKDGTEFYGQLVCMPVQDEEKDGNKYRAAVIDITDRKHMEKELQINRERLKTATSILRHDIINDLSVIKCAVDIYRNEQDETMLEEIEQRVEKSIATIHNQRDQIKFLDAHIALDEYDVGEVAHEVVKNYPNLEIIITGEGIVHADHALYSVFENIISNAVRHGKTTRLDIDINCDEVNCEIRFADYGIGIPDEIKDKIFDKGFQYGKTGHTGIGLYIVKRTVEEYNGEVFVKDNTPKGAVFVIRLKKAINRNKEN
jgi:PAS domain S-box-containing protein